MYYIYLALLIISGFNSCNNNLPNSCINAFSAVDNYEMSFFHKHKGKHYECRDTLWDENIINYAISKHRNEIAKLLIDEIENEKKVDLVKEEMLLEKAILSGNYEMVAKILELHDLLRIEINHKMLTECLYNFLSVFDETRFEADNDSEYSKCIPLDANYRMVDLFISDKYLGKHLLSSNKTNILFEVRKCSINIIEYAYVQTKININNLNSEGKTLLDKAIEDYTEPDFFSGIPLRFPEKTLTLIKFILKQGGKMSTSQDPLLVLEKWAEDNDDNELLQIIKSENRPRSSKNE